MQPLNDKPAIKQFPMSALGRSLAIGFVTLGLCLNSPALATTPAGIQAQESRSIQQVDVDDVTQAQIDRLIRQLSAPNYAVRQAAIEQLWELGAKAKSSLEVAAAADDSEVARRAGEILTVLSMGIDKNGSPETAKLVLHFHSSEQNVRIEVLRRLLNDDKFQLAFDLMAQVKDKDDQSSLFDAVIPFEDLLIRLARADNWEDFEFILGHPITFEQRAAAAAHYHLLNGTLETKTEVIEKAIATKQADGKKLDDTELQRLIAIFRLQDNFERANHYAKLIIDADLQTGMEVQLIKEQGDWSKLAERMIAPDENVGPEDHKFACAPAQQAIVHHFVGNETKFAATVESLVKKALEFEKDNDQVESKNLRDTLLQIGLSNLDWDLVIENLDPENKTRSFWIHSTNNRAKKSFEILELGESVEERQLWIDRRVRYFRSLTSKSKRLYESGKDNDEVDERKNEIWSNSIAVATLLGSLGHRDESVMFYQTLFATLEDDNQNYTRYAIISDLIELGSYDAAWELIEHGVDTGHYRQLLTYIFPTRSSSARFWFQRLKPRYADPLTRLKVTCGIVNSPLGTIADFDLNVELAAALSKTSQNSLTDYYLAKVYEFHGDFERSEHHFAASRDLGYGNANQSFAIDAVKRGEYDSALEYFEQTWRGRDSAVDSVLSAEAFRKTGRPHEAMLRQCLAFAFWKDSYRTSTTVSSLEAMEMSHLIKTILKMETIDMFGRQVASERYRDELATAQEKTEPARSAINLQLALFASLADSFDSQMIGYWSDTRKKINFALAKTKINAGKFEEAFELADRYSNFCPGDPDVAEEVVAPLDKAGQTELADRLFDKLTQHFVEIIEQFPESSTQHNNYAWTCAVARRGSEIMLRHALKACAILPNSSSSLDTLAEVYFQRGERAKAIELCERCIQLNPTKRHYREQLIRFKTETIE